MLLRVAGADRPWTLKAVTLDGEDITDTPMDWAGKGGVKGLRIVLTDKLTNVSGRVIDARGRPLKDYAVIVQPAEPKAGVVATRYLRVVRPDQSGSFRVTGLPPGALCSHGGGDRSSRAGSSCPTCRRASRRARRRSRSTKAGPGARPDADAGVE